MITIKYSCAEKASLTVSPGDGGPRNLGKPERRFWAEVEGYLAGSKAQFVWSGLESFGLTHASRALVLAILQKAPLVYADRFERLDPAFGSGLPVTPDQCEEAKAAWLSAAETHGTEIGAQGAKLRDQLILTAGGLRGLAERLQGVAELALDLETYPIGETLLKRDIGDTRLSDVRLLSVSDGVGVWLVDCRAVGQDLSPLRPVLGRANLVLHNADFDLPFLFDKYGVLPQGAVFDTLVAARVLSNESKLKLPPAVYASAVREAGDELINPKDLDEDDIADMYGEEKDEDEVPVFASKSVAKILTVFKGDPERLGNSLDRLYARFLKIEAGPDEAASDWKRPRLTDRQLAYAANDVRHLQRLRDAILAAADDEDRQIIELDQQVLGVCMALYRAGSPVDVAALEAVHARRLEALQAAREEAAVHLPGVDLASNVGCIRALGDAGVYVPSMDKCDLRQLSHIPMVAAVAKFRKVRAEVSDLEKLQRSLHPDRRIHARYRVGTTGTGRLSSRQPNLQNIRRTPTPEEAEAGAVNFRELFVAPEGYATIVGDLNQVELRAAAVLAQEPAMLQNYRVGGDLHRLTAEGLVKDFDALSGASGKFVG